MSTDTPLTNDRIDRDAGARGALYALLARLFAEPRGEVYERIASGELAATAEELVAASALDVDVPALTTDRSEDDLRAAFNGLFVLGYAEYEDRTDGSLDVDDPAVPLHESAYRPQASWNDVNLDLSRAYTYFGLGVDDGERRHHDHARLELEFAGFLARREAAVDPDVARARLDFHDRHLRHLIAGVSGRLTDEVESGFYRDLGEFLAAVGAADHEDLADRFDDGGVR